MTTGAQRLIDEKAAAARALTAWARTDEQSAERERVELAQAVKLREHGNEGRSDATTVGTWGTGRSGRRALSDFEERGS